MAFVDFFQGQGFIGANLTWNVVYGPLGSGTYWDVCLIPNSANESLAINRKTFQRSADGSLRLFVNYTNNSANDTFFDDYLVRIY
jgi:hypothetical protein